MFARQVNAILFGVALAASFPSARAAERCLDTAFRCNGFEPNWQLTTTKDDAGNPVVSFVDPENPDWETEPLVVGGCLLQGSSNDFEVTADEPLSLVASIVGQSCTEPNDDVTDFSVTVTFNQGAGTSAPNRVEGTGCCRILEQEPGEAVPVVFALPGCYSNLRDCLAYAMAKQYGVPLLYKGDDFSHTDLALTKP